MKRTRFIILFIILLSIFGIGLQRTKQGVASEKEIETIQTQVVKEEGNYNQKIIVLNAKGLLIADEIAEATGSILRITSDHSYGVIKLKEEYTVKTLLDNYPEYSDCFTLDYYSSVCEVENRFFPTVPEYNVEDEYYQNQSYLNYINLGNTWNLTKGSGITVAVIDTGIDTNHVEFEGKISDKSYNASLDKVGIEYIEDEQGHGTSVSGVIASSMNTVGVTGIAPEVTLLIIKCDVTPEGQFVSSSDLVFGLYYAIEKDVDIVNMSFGTYFNNLFIEPLKLAVASDIICVGAAGNDGTSALMYPAADPNCIGVGSLAHNSFELDIYSNYGENVDLVAPGTTFTTKIGGGYDYATGTSLACPVVTASLALYLSLNRYSEYEVVKEMIRASSKDLGALGNDWYHGFGALDVSELISGQVGTITYNSLTYEVSNTEQIFIRNHTIQYTKEPERLYTVFDGWYYDIECLEEYNYYEDIFVDDLILYAKWVNEDEGIPYTYVTLDDDTIELRSYTGKRRYITVPAEINGKVVSSIGDFCFSNNERLREILLPNTINKIANYSFYNCNRLFNINIPENVTSIGNNAFSNCVRLNTISIPSESLLLSIGDFAFSNTSINRFDISKHVKQLNGTAFYGCSGLRVLTVNEYNTTYKIMNNALYSFDESVLIYYPSSFSGEYNIINGTIKINDYAFSYSNIFKVNFPSTLITIGNDAFSYSRLKNIHIPNTILFLGYGSFSCNFYLEEVTFDNNMLITSIPSNTFSSCIKLRDIILFENLEIICSSAFSYCYELKNIVIPKTVVSIESYAFIGCLNLEEVIFALDSELNKIGAYSFASNNTLNSILLPSSLKTVESFAFYDSGLESIEIGENVEYIGEAAFATLALTNIIVDNTNLYYKDIGGVLFNYDESIIHTYPANQPELIYDLPNETKVINSYAFYYAINIENITLSSNLLEINSFAFSDCINLKTIIIPSTVTLLSSYSFYNDYNLTSISFEENTSLTRLSYGVFMNSGITSMIIPKEIESMAQYIFSGCKDLTSVSFEAGSRLENIAAYTFSGADKLSNINFDTDNSLISIQAYGLYNIKSLTSINIEVCNSLKTIDNYAFQGCKSLSSILFPNSLEEIGRYAFYNTNLSEITIPENVIYIGRYAFALTNNINVYFIASILPYYIQDDWNKGISGYYVGVMDVIETPEYTYAVLNDGNVSLIKYKGSNNNLVLSTFDEKPIISIGANAFMNNINLNSIALPNTITGIYDSAFEGCSNLSSIIISESVMIISDYAFYNSGLESIIFETNNLLSIGRYTFSKTQLAEIAIPDSIVEIKDNAFYNSSLESIYFSENSQLEKIGRSAFSFTNLSEIEIPSEVEIIDYYAFSNCSNLTNIVLPTTRELYIYGNCFSDSGLETINIPSNVRYLGEYIFTNCSALQSINVTQDNSYYSSVDGVLYNKNKTKIISYPSGKTGSYILPSTIEAIGFAAFENAKFLTSVDFSINSIINTIGLRAFFGCSGLTSIILPDSVLSIDYYAFAYCTNLVSFIVNKESLLSGIYEGAFYNCNKLESIYLPKEIKEISDYSFYGCNNLIEVTYSDAIDLKGIYDYAFAYTNLQDLIIPESLLEIGSYAFLGLAFENVLELNLVNVKSIGLGAFEGMNNLETLHISNFGDEKYGHLGYIFGANHYDKSTNFVPPTLKTVYVKDVSYLGDYAFYKCHNIENIYLSDTILMIGKRAFYECYSLIEIKLPKYLTVISESMLFYCTNLTEIVLPINLIEIHSAAFQGTSLKRLILPDTVEFIGAVAFNIWTLEYLEISANSNLKKLDYGVFIGTKIEYLFVPKYLEHIGDSVFQDVNSLIKINLHDSNLHFELFNNCLYTSDGCVLVLTPKLDFGDLIIKEGTKVIASGAASGAAYTKVVMPDSVIEVKPQAFSHCYNLNDLTLGINILTIGDHAFLECFSLETFQFPVNVTIYTSNMLTRSGIKNLVLPSTITTIDFYAFTNSSFETIYIPDSVKYIGGESLRGSTNTVILFESCSLPRHEVTWNKDWDHSDIKYYLGIKNIVEIGNAIYIIDKDDSAHLYRYLGTDTIVYIDELSDYKLESIFAYSFQGNTTMKELYVNASIKEIGTLAFFHCTSLEKVEIIDGLEIINDSAFEDCFNLLSFKMPNSVLIIGNNVFNNIWGIQTMNLSTNLEEIGSHNLNNKDGTDIEYEYGVYYIDNVAFACDDQLTELIVRNGTRLISPDAFRENKNIVKVILPEGLLFIGDYAFAWCSNIEKVILPEGLLFIGDYAFAWCSNIEKVILPISLKIIKEGAFRGCSSLLKLSIPNNVKSIGNGAFIGCISVDYIYYNAINCTDSFPSSWIFADVGTETNGIKLVIGNKVERIPNYLFDSLPYQNMNVTMLIFEKDSNCKSIGDEAFSWMVSLEYLELPISLEEISGSAFSFSKNNLKTIVIDNYDYNVYDSDYLFASPRYGEYFEGKVIVKSISNIDEISILFNSFKNAKIYLNVSEDEYGEWVNGWNTNDNIIYYQGEWFDITFYDSKALMLSYNPQSIHEVVKTPANNLLIKSNDETYSYTFIGWDVNGDGLVDTIPTTLTANIKAYPVYEREYIKYTITFVDEDDEVISTNEDYYYGDLIVLPSVPSKASTPEFTYTFNSWTGYSTEMLVTKDMIFKATYTSDLRSYTVTFINDDGSILYTEVVLYGNDATYLGEAPVKAADQQYTYTFTGWSLNYTGITSALEVKALYTNNINSYMVYFYNEDKTILLGSDSVLYGEDATYNGATPTKAGNAQYSYIFRGWSNAITNITGDLSISATFNQITNQYTYKFINGAEVIKEVIADYGTLIELPEAPLKESTVQYTYSFDKWTGYSEGLTLTEEVTFTALYNAVINRYTVIFVNYDDVLVDTQTVDYGTNVQTSVVPTRLPDDNFIYTFKAWDTDTSFIASDLTVKALYNSRVNSLVVSFQNHNGSVLYETTVKHGEAIEYIGETPLRESTKEFDFTFTGWDNIFDNITDDIVIKATYSSTLRKYTYTFLDDEGNILFSDTVDYGTIIIIPDPNKPNTPEYIYEFLGWDIDVPSMVTGNVVITGLYGQNAQQYTVNFFSEDGTTHLGLVVVGYGEEALYPNATPTKASTAEYSYVFTGWSEDTSYIISSLDVSAIFSRVVNQYTVTFDSVGGSLIDPVKLEYGSLIVLPTSPTKTSTPEFTFTFAFWDGYTDGMIIEEDVTLIASYTETINQYTVTFDSAGGSLVTPITLDYGTLIVLPTSPTKEATQQYTYIFASWDGYTDGMIIEEDVTLIASYTETINQYTVTFDSAGGNLVSPITLDYGTLIVLPTSPTKEATQQYTFTFASWDGYTDGMIIEEDLTLTASYTETINQYTVTFDTNGGSLVCPITLDYGSLIVLPTSPTKAKTQQYTFTFASWGGYTDGMIIEEDVTLTATYSQVVNQYIVTFDTDGGSLIDPVTLDYGTIIVLPTSPTKEATQQYTYTFASWDGYTDGMILTEDLTLTATYGQVINQYTVTFDSTGGSLVNPITLDYGSLLVLPTSPTKEATQQYTFTFVSWDGYTDGMIIEEDVTLIASYTETINQYTVTFDSDGGSIVNSITLDYGTIIVLPTSPTKEATQQYTYIFASWDGYTDGMIIEEDVTLIASYTETINQYTVTFDSAGGNLVSPITLDYGTLIVLPTSPTKAKTQQYTYSFASWDGYNDGMILTEDLTLTATYSQTVNQYTVTFDSAGGSLVTPITLDYGTLIVLPTSPTKEATQQYTFTFASWDGYTDGMIIKEDVTLTAVYNQTIKLEKNEVEQIIGQISSISLTNYFALASAYNKLKYFKDIYVDEWNILIDKIAEYDELINTAKVAKNVSDNIDKEIFKEIYELLKINHFDIEIDRKKKWWL